jgi:uncharacterized membrane protein
MGNLLVAVLATVGVSLMPGLEMKGGIPVGMAMGLSAPVAAAAAVAGTLLQIPLAFWAVAAAYRRFARLPRVRQWLERTEDRAGRHAALIRRWGWLGLAAFVVTPLPASGVWGGVVLARLLGLAPGLVWLGLGVGIGLSGALYGLASHGAFTAARLFW